VRRAITRLQRFSKCWHRHAITWYCRRFGGDNHTGPPMAREASLTDRSRLAPPFRCSLRCSLRPCIRSPTIQVWVVFAARCEICAFKNPVPIYGCCLLRSGVQLLPEFSGAEEKHVRKVSARGRFASATPYEAINAMISLSRPAIAMFRSPGPPCLTRLVTVLVRGLLIGRWPAGGRWATPSSSRVHSKRR